MMTSIIQVSGMLDACAKRTSIDINLKYSRVDSSFVVNEHTAAKGRITLTMSRVGTQNYGDSTLNLRLVALGCLTMLSGEQASVHLRSYSSN